MSCPQTMVALAPIVAPRPTRVGANSSFRSTWARGVRTLVKTHDGPQTIDGRNRVELGIPMRLKGFVVQFDGVFVSHLKSPRPHLKLRGSAGDGIRHGGVVQSAARRQPS